MSSHALDQPTSGISRSPLWLARLILGLTLLVVAGSIAFEVLDPRRSAGA